MRVRWLDRVALAVWMSATMLLPGAAIARTPALRDVGLPAVEFVHVDGAQLAYRDINPTAHGAPLLLIVGYGSTMAEWDPQLVARLAQRRRVIMFDNRGAGDSTGPVSHLTIRLMAGDAAGLLRRLRLGRTDVLGLVDGWLHRPAAGT